MTTHCQQSAKLLQRLTRFLEDNDLEGSTASELLIALGDFDRGSLGFAFWLRPYTKYRQSEGFKHRINRQGISDYWREAGFPAMCEPLGQDDFECRRPYLVGLRYHFHALPFSLRQPFLLHQGSEADMPPYFDFQL